MDFFEGRACGFLLGRKIGKQSDENFRIVFTMDIFRDQRQLGDQRRHEVLKTFGSIVGFVEHCQVIPIAVFILQMRIHWEKGAMGVPIGNLDRNLQLS